MILIFAVIYLFMILKNQYYKGRKEREIKEGKKRSKKHNDGYLIQQQDG